MPTLKCRLTLEVLLNLQTEQSGEMKKGKDLYEEVERAREEKSKLILETTSGEYESTAYRKRQKNEKWGLKSMDLSETQPNPKGVVENAADLWGQVQSYSNQLFFQLIKGNNAGVSEKKIETEKLPSNIEWNTEWKEISLKTSKALLYEVAMQEYIFAYFSSYTDQREVSDLEYEVEYILQGKEKDEENLVRTWKEIVILRTGLNLLHLFQQAEKREQAYQAAVILVGWTGIPGIIEAFYLSLMGEWAWGEAILDLRALTEGKKVPLIKTSVDWTLDFGDISALLLSTESGKVGNEGLDYEAYLRILMITRSGSDMGYRAADLMTLFLQEADKKFTFEKSYFAVSVQCTVKISSRYSKLFERLWDLRGKEFYLRDLSGVFIY